ncbi:lipopolysaccharide heptosyltransferase II [Desulfurobacterium atlanticum]|uniref:lipopolysaccharide heptosyltransferase II n=1 Tax=Desulfurobacterium atlanticum TaxID=240169 RepID=A0A239AEH3_9BACT|nr:lipopolysaccharide heptosyltransferase II [Desulfurobacterium atlanticum]SNR93428.1 heptosyltransferase-2 [Desulfurobacterium atlanticum]
MKILIFQTAFIGDLVLASSLIKSVKKTFSESSVSLVCKKGYESIYKRFEYLDEVIPYDKKGIRGFAALLKEKRFDVVFSPHRSHRTSTVLFLARIPERIGFDNSGFSFLYTKKVKYEKGLHEVERNIKLLLSYKSDAVVDLKPELYVSDSEKGQVLEKFGIGAPYAVISPGSVWPTKRWIPEYFAKVALFLKRKGLVPVIAGGPQDREIAETVAKGAKGAVNTAGKTSLREFMALISQAQVVITNDSSPTHFAVAFDRPVVTIFGPTVKEFGFYPYSKKGRVAEINLYCRPCGIHGGKRCKEKHFKCMRDLTPEKVIPLVEEVLNSELKL